MTKKKKKERPDKASQRREKKSRQTNSLGDSKKPESIITAAYLTRAKSPTEATGQEVKNTTQRNTMADTAEQIGPALRLRLKCVAPIKSCFGLHSSFFSGLGVFTAKFFFPYEFGNV